MQAGSKLAVCRSFEGSQVRLHSMSAAVLNGALCEVVEDCISQDRVSVRVLSPHEAVAAHPNGAKIKRSNITPVLPAEEQLQEWEQLASFDSGTRLGICGAIVDDFISACMQDCYPFQKIRSEYWSCHAPARCTFKSRTETHRQHRVSMLARAHQITRASRHNMMHAILSRKLPEYSRSSSGMQTAAIAQLSCRRGFGT